MPEAAMASACWRINCSLTLQANLFQELQPMGGVGARLGLGASSLRVSCAWTGAVKASTIVAAVSTQEAQAGRKARECLCFMARRVAAAYLALSTMALTRSGKYWAPVVRSK